MKFFNSNLSFLIGKYSYYHIDEYSRDSVVASALKKKLKANGIHLIYGSRRLGIIINKFPSLISFCGSIIFPSIDIYKSYFNEGDIKFSKIFILPTESISGTKDTERRLIIHLLGSEFENKDKQLIFLKIEKIFLWGKLHEKLLLKFDPKLEPKILVVGHPRYDKDCLKSSFYGRPQSKVRIGFISRFDLLNIYDARSNLEIIYQNRKIPGRELKYFQNKDRDQENYYHNVVLDLRIFLRLLDSIDLDKYEMHLKVHPRESRANWEKLVIRNNIPLAISDYGEPFAHWLKNIDIVLSPPSTTFYDCALLGKHAILIDKISKSRESHASIMSDDFDPIFSYFKRPNSINETLEYIKKLNGGEAGEETINSQNLYKILENEVNYPFQGSSLDKVAEEISKHSHKRGVAVTAKYLLFVFSTLIYTYGILIFRFIKRRDEESANFLLTLYKKRVIDNLAL